MKFARVFDFEAGQLLINITTDTDVDGFVLSLETYYHGSFIRTGFLFAKFDDACESMNALTEARAEQLFGVLTQLNSSPVAVGRGKKEALESFKNWLNVLRKDE